MKKILGIIFISLLVFSSALQAQVCDGVSAEAIPLSPQTGSNNYFGVRVTLSQTYNQDVTVTGYIFAESSPNQNNPFTLTITAGNLTAETDLYFFQTGPADGAGVEISSVTPCPSNNSIIVTYAGVSITYETNNNILKFNSIANANAVLDQLDAEYDAHNENYENQYPNLTAEQLDDMDAQTGFDYLKTFRDFENLFPGYTSKRSEIENTERVWLANNFTGTDPDDIDLTFDDAENTIFNNAYSFKVGNDIYQLTSTGMYINGVLQNDSGSSRIMKENNGIIYAGGVYFNNGRSSGPTFSNAGDRIINLFSICKTNKKLIAPPFQPQGTNKRFVLKVAIHSIGVRSSIKGKVVHYKLKNGNWERARARLAVGVSGYVNTTSCSSLGIKSDSNPITGYKKRSQLKARKGAFGTIWKAYNGEITGSFATPEGYGGTLPLTW
jgi:hypothetical protein